MADELSLAQRIEAEFATATQKMTELQQQKLEQYQGRQQRLETLEKTLEGLKEVWRPRLTELSQRFADKVKVTPVVGTGRRLATFEFQSELAHINLRFSVLADEDVRNIIFQYDLQILPVFIKFDSYSEIKFPLENVDRQALAGWIDDRIISFVQTYLSIHQNYQYLEKHLVEDPIAKVRFPKFAAGAKLEWKGKTLYFLADETCRQFKQQQSQSGP